MKNEIENQLLLSDFDYIFMVAAVADFTPMKYSDNKIKSDSDIKKIELKKTIDIMSQIISKSKAIKIAFALETENEMENATAKLQQKNLDLIVLNSLNDKGAGFSHDTNKITIIEKDNNVEEFELKHKSEVAKDIMDKIIQKLNG